MPSEKYKMYTELQHLFHLLSLEAPTQKQREFFKACNEKLNYDTLTPDKINTYIKATTMLLRHHNINYEHKYYEAQGVVKNESIFM